MSKPPGFRPRPFHSGSSRPEQPPAQTSQGPMVVALDKFDVGYPDPDRVVPLRPPQSLLTLLTQPWGWDAHVTCYAVPDGLGGREAEWPRLTKAALAPMTEAGQAPMFEVTFLDWDVHGHKPLGPEHVAMLEDLVPTLEPRPSCWWTSLHGARLGFVHPAIDAKEAEEVHRGLVQLYADQGLACDTQISDWTRLHRLPKVLRDGKRTEQHPLFQLHVLDLAPQTLDGVPRLTSTRSVFDHATRTLEEPTHQECVELVWTQGTRSADKLTPWGRQAKSKCRGRLEGRLPKFFEEKGTPLEEVASGGGGANDTSRNEFLMSASGCMTALLKKRHPGTTPEHLFGVLLPSIQNMTYTGPRNFFAEAWKCVCSCWARDKEELDHQHLERLSLEQRLLQRIGDRWWDDPEWTPEELRKHLILSVDGSHFVLQGNGLYNATPTPRYQIFSVLRDSGLSGPSGLVNLVRETPQGPRDVSDTYLLNHYSTQVPGPLHKSLGPPGAWLDGDHLVVGSYQRRTDLSPTYSEDVDQWLRHMFGPYYQKVQRWIGLALAFERGPICALSISGPPGVGKKLLVMGLSETTTTQKVVTSGTSGKWQLNLGDTPWVNINEAWPVKKEVDAFFRNLISGDLLEVNRKYQPVTHVQHNPRVVMTANNWGLAERLFCRRDMTLDDQRATADRLFHMTLSNDAEEWLARKGQRSYTHGWIADDGVRSNYTVARHFLYLYEKYGQIGGATRFLMQGQTRKTDLWLLTVGTGANEVVAELLSTMIQLNKLPPGDDGEVRVTAEVALTYYRANMQFDHKKIFSRLSMGKALTPFVKAGVPANFSKGGRAIDVDKLETFMRDEGEIAEERKTSGRKKKSE